VNEIHPNLYGQVASVFPAQRATRGDVSTGHLCHSSRYVSMATFAQNRVLLLAAILYEKCHAEWKAKVNTDFEIFGAILNESHRFR
jgi:hypothetical protein